MLNSQELVIATILLYLHVALPHPQPKLCKPFIILPQVRKSRTWLRGLFHGLVVLGPRVFSALSGVEGL